jgi:hypothetical protein
MPEYISKDVAFQRLLCKESGFNHWNDYNLAQYMMLAVFAMNRLVCAVRLRVFFVIHCENLSYANGSYSCGSAVFAHSTHSVTFLRSSSSSKNGSRTKMILLFFFMMFALSTISS